MTDNNPARENIRSLSKSKNSLTDEIPEKLSPESLENIITILANNPILAGLSAEILYNLYRFIWKIRMPAHTVIFHQGDTANTLYIIQTGKVRLFRKGETGPDIDLANMGPGECFGELSLLTGKNRMRSAETLEDTDLLIIEKQDFDQIIRGNPHLLTAFMNHFSNLIEQIDRKFESEAGSKYRVPGVSVFDFVVIFLLSLFLGFGFNFTNPFGVKIISASHHKEELSKETPVLAKQKHNNNTALFVDARPQRFYEQQRIKGSINLPSALFDIMYLMEFSGIGKEQEVIVYGRTISTLYDQHVAKKLLMRGHKNTKILEGDLSLWIKHGYPVEP